MLADPPFGGEGEPSRACDAAGMARHSSRSALLLANARGFHESAVRARNPDRDAHALAIADELACKAFLSAAGVPTGVLVAIGHDLRLAEALARGLGLTLPNDRAAPSRLFHPHFQRGGFQRQPARRWPPSVLRRARRRVAALIELVERRLDRTGAARYRATIARLDPIARAVLARSLADESLATIAAGLGIDVDAAEAALARALISLDRALQAPAAAFARAALPRRASPQQT